VGDIVVSNRTFALCVCALLLMSTLSRSEQAKDLDGKDISFKLYGKYLVVVQGSLGELRKRNFLVDTGTNPTIVDEKIAEQLQLAPLTGMPNTLPVISGGVKAQFAVLPALQFGPIHRERLRVTVEDLSVFRDKVGTRIDAVVGLDVLGQSSFRIDYSRHRIFFGPLGVTGSTVSFSSGPPFVTVPMMIENRAVNVLIDTGTAGLVLFQSRLGAWDRGLPQLGVATTSGLAGPVYLPVLQVRKSVMGNEDVGIRQIYLGNGYNCCSFDGLMGISADQMRVIGFDFEHRLFTWQLQGAAIPTMSESRPEDCLPASAPGLALRSEAGGAPVSAFASGCGMVSAASMRR
jgi:Aspartyl protease